MCSFLRMWRRKRSLPNVDLRFTPMRGTAPPLGIGEANHLREMFYTFEKPGVVHFKLLTRNEEQELVENLQIGEAPQPTFTVIVE